MMALDRMTGMGYFPRELKLQNFVALRYGDEVAAASWAGLEMTLPSLDCRLRESLSCFIFLSLCNYGRHYCRADIQLMEGWGGGVRRIIVRGYSSGILLY